MKFLNNRRSYNIHAQGSRLKMFVKIALFVLRFVNRYLWQVGRSVRRSVAGAESVRGRRCAGARARAAAASEGLAQPNTSSLIKPPAFIHFHFQYVRRRGVTLRLFITQDPKTFWRSQPDPLSTYVTCALVKRVPV